MEETDMAIPPFFKCPISLDLFTDPVTLCTGQTYDRSSIEKWLAAGNLTCPVTMQKLDDLSVVPNHTLRHLIDQWLQEGSQSQVTTDYVETINYDYDCSIAALKHKLILNEFALEEKLHVLEIISVLSDELPLQNSLLIELDFFVLLLEQVFRHANGVYSEEDIIFSEQALTCALKLYPFSDLRSLNLLKEESLLENFISLFGTGSMNIKRYLCNLMDVISSCSETQELCGMLGKSHKFLQEIIHLLLEKSEVSEAGIKAISALSSLESNRETLVSEAAVEGLIEYIMNAEKHKINLATIATATIERLFTVERAKEVAVNHPSGIRALVKMVFRVSDHQGSESAVNSLLALCCDSHHAMEEAICSGVMTQLLLLLQSQCNGWTKSRARILLKLLKSMWVEGQKQASDNS